MTLVQAAYEILVTLSICDGDYDEDEGRVILDFLNDNHDGSFDLTEANQRLMSMEKDAIEAHFDELAGWVAANSSDEDKTALLEFGLDLIMSDEELSEDENRLVQKLATTWDVPLQPLVARAMGIND